ncbi:hypothetical protein Zm00014a_036211 [Zea mays]|uniref:Transposase-associated domain-containing protein n=1 Tax=Zea mays TaxID=4577 RepID=A0A3L6E2Q3_MAIZE|nr:hypothetical protein Zm00014a_036211 [Zea mays]
MDREQWMYGIDRSDINYFHHVQGFLNVAEKHQLDNMATTILCPCVDCRNFDPIIDSRVILGHLIMRGFTSGYTCWTNHGECSIGDNNGNMSHPGFRGPKPGREHNHQVCWDQVSHIW